MKRVIGLIMCLAFVLKNAEGQIGRLALSPVQKIEQIIGVTDITIVYSRPSKRGREIFGDLVPYNELWRTGANRNTTIEFTKDVIIAGQRMDKGKYAVFSIPSPQQWEILFYKDTDNWDVPEVLDSTKIAARIKVSSSHLNKELEVFTISIGDFTNYAFDLHIAWSNVSISIPIELTTKELMDKKISRVLKGPDYADYYAAAEYQMESGKEFKKGLEWIEKAMEVTEEVTWWDLRIQAILLMELGENEKALKVAKEGLKMAKEKNRAYGINEFGKVLRQLQD